MKEEAEVKAFRWTTVQTLTEMEMFVSLFLFHLHFMKQLYYLRLKNNVLFPVG